MIDKEKVIKGLECCLDELVQSEHALTENGVVMSSWQDSAKRIDAIRGAIAFLKAQEQATIEPKRIELADETKAWLDKMDAVDALENISSICLDWDGYRTANGLGGLINEIWAYARYCADKLLKAQEPEALDMPKPDSEIGCWYDITHNYTLEQVVSALKSQEPRVMTLEEVKMLDSDYYYLESMRSPGKELREIVGAYGLTCVTWPSITWARQTMGDSGYGKTWRCWTSRPTDEQRRAVAWG